MKEPIIVYENGAVDIFDRRDRAEAYVEPIDVRNNEYVFYDSEGQLLEALIVEDSRGIEHVVLQDGKEEIYDKPGLALILARFLNYLGYQKNDLEQMSLSQLVDEGLKFKTE
jgi:hypothetical protein